MFNRNAMRLNKCMCVKKVVLILSRHRLVLHRRSMLWWYIHGDKEFLTSLSLLYTLNDQSFLPEWHNFGYEYGIYVIYKNINILAISGFSIKNNCFATVSTLSLRLMPQWTASHEFQTPSQVPDSVFFFNDWRIMLFDYILNWV